MAFWQLTVPNSPETSDGLTNFLWEQGALGVVEEELPTEPGQLLAFFPGTASSTRLLDAVTVYRSSLRALGFPVAPTEPRIAPLLDGAWASAWQQSFPPRPVGRRLLVAPPWETAATPDPDRVSVIIEPGRAFGTGHHGSTEGCLVLLEQVLASRPAWPAAGQILDIGTGSGILAIAAAKLAGAAALALDVDPDAVAAAEANAHRNDCGDRVTVRLDGPEALDPGARFPLVLANLLTHTHLALHPLYARLVPPGGALVLGGILADEDREVAQALERGGFTLSTRLVVDGWSSLLFSRNPR